MAAFARRRTSASSEKLSVDVGARENIGVLFQFVCVV